MRFIFVVLILSLISCASPAPAASLETPEPPCVTSTSPSSLVVHWSLQSAPPIAPGQTAAFIATSPRSVDVWTTPALGTDVVANTRCDGTGQDRTMQLRVSVEKSGASMSIRITNPTRDKVYLRLLQARAASSSNVEIP